MNASSTEIETLVFGSAEWWLPAGIVTCAVIVLAVWSYARRGQLSSLRFATMFLKIAAVVALAFCLLEPMRRVERPRPGANLMGILVDNSRSMEIRPPSEGSSFADQVRGQLSTQSVWQSRLAQDFDIRRYAFEDRLSAVDDLEELEFDGKNSSLAAAIDTLGVRFDARPVAGMILFSDGLATDQASNLAEMESLPFPIYPVVFGSQSKLQDVSLSEASCSLSAFELAPAAIEARLDVKGLAGEKVVVRLIDRAGETIEKQTVDCDSDDFGRRVRFQYRPKDPGFQLVSVRAMLAKEDTDSLELESRREVTLANNTRIVAVHRGGGPYRILYVAGRPNWEFKFIRRALEEDVELELKALVRIAKEEPKFSFRDKGVQTANPLMAGFSDNEETIERYDEPVLLRLGVDEDELKAGFPSGEEDLFHYHAIVLDDVEAGFFTQQQMLLIRKFVAERGGGLMMLGGQESFLGGGYRDTPLGDVLPVYLRGQNDAATTDNQVRYRLTREGGLEPWLRLRANQTDESRRVGEMPTFLTWNPVGGVKPGASVLAKLETDVHERPGLVTQRFGRGRSLALLVGDFWRWSMRRATPETDDLAQSWRQMARWLTADVPKRVEVEVENPTDALSPHRVRIEALDLAYEPLDNATIEIVVTEPDGTEVSASAVPSADRPGQYVAEYWARTDGGYQARIDVSGPDGEDLDSVDTGWTAEPSALEFARVEPDVELLRKLAERSGGELVNIDSLDEFVSSLPSRKVPITESRVEPLWHRPWFVLFAITCLCLEWGIRRWKGLP